MTNARPQILVTNGSGTWAGGWCVWLNLLPVAGAQALSRYDFGARLLLDTPLPGVDGVLGR